VLLQPINTGTLVYNRRQVKGRTHVPRPTDEHVVVEGFCDPIFARDEMDELLQFAAEIEGAPPARTGSTYLLSGLVYCRCGSRMYPVKNYVTTKRGRHAVLYYRCRRASHTGTCEMRQVPAAGLSRRSSLNCNPWSSEPRGGPGSRRLPRRSSRPKSSRSWGVELS
jgi:Recombinase zinc beta ribbon domain